MAAGRVKNFARRLLSGVVTPMLQKCGYQLKRVGAPVSMEAMLYSTFNERSDVTFIQVGAFDGVANDPISRLRKQVGWRGIVIEANPVVFPTLRSSLESCPSITPLNVAIAMKSGFVDFFRVLDPQKTHFPYWAKQISSLSRSHIRKTLIEWGHSDSEIDSLVDMLKVPALTFTDLLAQQNISEIELLILDVEGMDFQLLNSFPFDRVVPNTILFESAHMTPAERSDLPHLLHRFGYSFYEIGIDTICRQWK